MSRAAREVRGQGEHMEAAQNGSNNDLRTAGGIVIGFFALYVCTLCPTVYLGDSGEICAAIAGGGVVHPPGYPLFSLLGRLALLLPFGEAAFRIGIVVALAGAGAVGVLFLTARAVGASPLPAFLAAGAFGAGYTFWSQCVRVEVYSLHLLLALTALWAALRFRATGNPRWLYGAALAFSLGLAHHLTIVLLAPPLAILCFAPWRTSARPGWVALTLLPLFVVGPSLYGLLWFWASGKPLQAWGDPTTPALLWSHASARLYQGLFLRLPDAPQWHVWYRTAWALLLDSLPYGLFVPAVLGLGLLVRRDRIIGAGLGVLFSTVALYNLCYRIEDIAPYYLVAWVVLALGLAAALEWTRSRVRLFHEPHPGLAAGLALLVLVPIARNWQGCDLSRATWVREFARAKLESAAPDAVLVTQGDADCFPIWYVRDVLGVRRDVLPVDRLMTIGAWVNEDRDPSRWYLERLRREGVPVSGVVPLDRETRKALGRDGQLLQLFEGPLKQRPLYTTFLRTQTRRPPRFIRWALTERIPVPVGLLVRLEPAGRPVDLPRLIAESEARWVRFQLPRMAGVRTDQELAPDYVVGHYSAMLLSLGGLHEKAGAPDRARRVYEEHVAWAPTPQIAAEGRRALQELDRKLVRTSDGPAGE